MFGLLLETCMKWVFGFWTIGLVQLMSASAKGVSWAKHVLNFITTVSFLSSQHSHRISFELDNFKSLSGVLIILFVRYDTSAIQHLWSSDRCPWALDCQRKTLNSANINRSEGAPAWAMVRQTNAWWFYALRSLFFHSEHLISADADETYYSAFWLVFVIQHQHKWCGRYSVSLLVKLSFLLFKK